MISNNPSWPNLNPSSKEWGSFDAQTARELEKQWLNIHVSQKLAGLKAEMPDAEKKAEVVQAIEEKFPGQDNWERVAEAMKTLEKSKDRIANNLSKKFKLERTSLAEKLNSNLSSNETPQSSTKNIVTETTDWLKAFVSGSLPEAGKLVWKFFKDIWPAFADIWNSARYIWKQADWLHENPKTESTTTFNA